MKKIIFILIALFVWTSCKKENKIRRNLHNDDGLWEIVKYEETITSNFSLNEKNIVNENIGMMYFEEDHSGWIIKSEGIETVKAPFKYDNTDSELLLRFSSSLPVENYELNWEKNSFSMSKNSTNTYTVFYTPTNDSITITDKITVKYTCKKM